MGEGQPQQGLIEYLYVDQRRLRGYLEQLAQSKGTDKHTELEVGLSLKGPSVSAKQISETREATDHEGIVRLLAWLQVKKQLETTRSLRPLDYRMGMLDSFIHETMTAQKVVLPMAASQIVPGLKELAIWVSQPTNDALSGTGYGEGTFIFLIEAYWEKDERCGGGLSGFSAMDWILLRYKKGIVKSDMELLPLAQDLHQRQRPDPMEILRMEGAYISTPRLIRALYRIRYVDDETFFTKGKTRHRSFSIVGYPVFIAQG